MDEVKNGSITLDHYGPVGDASRNIASYCDGPARVHVYTAALEALTTARATIAQQGEELARMREATQAVVDALVKHHQWHAAQTDPDPEHGFIPADEYAESGMYEQTVAALHTASLATGPHDFAARQALESPKP